MEKISPDMDESHVKDHLEIYKQKAIDLGATRVCVFNVRDIPVDDRVPLKCQVPRCFGYGTSANCPPNTLKPDELRMVLKNYNYSIFFIKDIPSTVIVRDRATIKERVAVYQDVYNIVSKIESLAFYDGHYLAFGLGAGSCRHTFCGLEKNCRALEGDRCRFSLRARPSMEAVGIDVYKMVSMFKWDIYPIGSSAKPDDIPKGTLAGIIIIQ